MSAITPRKLLASTALAVVFASQAGAAGLIDDNRAILRYSGEFPTALRQAAKDDAAPGLHSRGFMTDLESKLKNRTEKPQIVVYPPQNSMNMLVTAAVVPPVGMEDYPIDVCSQQNGKIVGAWKIAANGAVSEATAIPNPSGSQKAACNETIVTARTEVATKYAAMQQKQPPSAQTPAPTKSIVVGLNP